MAAVRIPRGLQPLACVLALSVLSACASDVVLRDPRTGAAVTCAEPLKGFNPYSQTDACVASHVAQGWIPLDDSATAPTAPTAGTPIADAYAIHLRENAGPLP